VKQRLSEPPEHDGQRRLKSAKSVYEALWYHKPPLHVVSHGKLVDRQAMAAGD
jgi:hypothetical protein